MNEAEVSENAIAIAARAVDNFATVFRGADSKSRQANLKEALRWWNGRESYLEALRQPKNKCMRVYSRLSSGVRIPIKALSGRESLRSAWVDNLHSFLFPEFDRLGSSSVQLRRQLLKDIACEALLDPHAPFQSTDTNEHSHRPVLSHIILKWVDSFLNRCSIVIRKQSGSLSRCTAHNNYTEKLIAFHLAQIELEFASGSLDQNMVENMDETHFIFNMDNHHTLGVRGSSNVNYADVVSGGEGMTMVLRICGGENAKIEAPFMRFRNRNRSYPIQRVPDNVPGVSYRSGPRGWMDKTVLNHWLNEPRAISRDPIGRTRYLFMDNCSGHNETPHHIQSLHAIKTKIRYLPENSTHCISRWNHLLFKKIKAVWRSDWETEKLRRIEVVDWSTGPTGSGKLNNPGIQYYLKQAVKCMDKVNSIVDSNGLSLVRKAMIRAGLALDVDGTWRKEQLFDVFQDSVERHHMEFCGLEPEYEMEE